jgi:hypothetical protein
MAKVFFAEPTQAPFIREAEAAPEPLAPGKALGELIAATDRDICNAVAAVQEGSGDGGGAHELLHPLRSFMGHLERPETAQVLVTGCLNHLLEAQPPKKSKHPPRAVRLLLAAANSLRAWPVVCGALVDILRGGDKRLKLAACAALHEVLVTSISTLGSDPRAQGGKSAITPQATAATALGSLVHPLLPLTALLVPIAERDGVVDESSSRGDLLPTRLTTLAADCCITMYVALGRLALLPRASSLPEPGVETMPDVAPRRPNITISSPGFFASAPAESSASESSDDDSNGAREAETPERGAETRAKLLLWGALPDMQRVLRLLRQWYAGRKPTLVTGVDAFLARLEPIAKLFHVQHHRMGQHGGDAAGTQEDAESYAACGNSSAARGNSQVRELECEAGGMLGLVWVMLGPPLLAEGGSLIRDLRSELGECVLYLPANALGLSEHQRRDAELSCELALVSICFLLGRAKRKARVYAFVYVCACVRACVYTFSVLLRTPNP